MGSLADAIRPFEQLTDRYEAWFVEHPHAFQSELAALEPLMAGAGRSLEVGIGSARFAAPLGVTTGVEPSRAMAGLARKRGVPPVQGVGEALPFADATFERVLVVVTLCYLDDPQRAFEEARRVLTPSGRLVLGFIDRATPLGQRYDAGRSTNPFYQPVRFYSLAEVEALLEASGFETETVRTTLTVDPDAMRKPEPVEAGRGEGAFVALSARPV